ncbi:hypothetical protein LDO31_02750 [Luteimonas sp. XNQY3]|nr:hypothetical protein [Luteimonas sp. XNQY3]MCD9005165.1 hypothetical protein [Luteimonas sp. XNQY3]
MTDATRHQRRRAPRKNWGFSWGRFPSARVPGRNTAGHIAGVLLAARQQLREAVDEIDLAALMQEAA